jgi:hypothetical protein
MGRWGDGEMGGEGTSDSGERESYSLFLLDFLEKCLIVFFISSNIF